ncbi:MogA/MoaB family molybdenum cofactor biosynthesis protein [Candidatus Bathyarchaeota archaeon]|nr:MogA/MoaB family molybdenum cofactor biosynthesis protein [Candidatus Bathyarchaeota archaeon]
MPGDHPRDQEARTVFAFLVTSDTRTPDTDKTGKAAVTMIEEGGHRVKKYGIVPNDAGEIRAWLETALADGEVRVIVTSGGTGMGAKDKTVDAACGLFDRELPGFGEHFRRLSVEEIGLPGVWSRATAAVVGDKIVFCLPGSRGAVATALSKIILPGVGHMLWELDRR